MLLPGGIIVANVKSLESEEIYPLQSSHNCRYYGV